MIYKYLLTYMSMDKKEKYKQFKEYFKKNIVKIHETIFKEITLFGGNLFFLFFTCLFLFLGEITLFLRLIQGYILIIIFGIIIRFIYNFIIGKNCVIQCTIG